MSRFILISGNDILAHVLSHLVTGFVKQYKNDSLYYNRKIIDKAMIAAMIAAMIKLMVTIRMINLVPVSINVTRDDYMICLVPLVSISIQQYKCVTGQQMRVALWNNSLEQNESAQLRRI